MEASYSKTLLLFLAIFVISSFSQDENRYQIRITPSDTEREVAITWVVENSWYNQPIYENSSFLQVGTARNQLTSTISAFEVVPYSLGSIFRARVSNLNGTTRYFFRVGNLGGAAPSTEYNFRPLVPTPIRVSLVCIANIDSGATFQIYIPVIVSLFDGEYGPGLVPGNSAGGSAVGDFDRLGKAIEPFSARFPLFLTPGPRDFDNNGEANVYSDRFPSPNMVAENVNSTATAFWYSYDFSTVHLITLSTLHNYTEGSEQYEWLVNDLQSANLRRSRFPWIIVSAFSPMYSSVGSDFYWRREIEPLLIRYGVDLCVWNGNYYSQSKPLGGWGVSVGVVGTGEEGTPYINPLPIHLLVGTGGLGLNDVCVLQDWESVSTCTYGVTNVTVEPDGRLFGVFRQVPILHSFEAKRDLSAPCPRDCMGNGECSLDFKKCICNPNYYGSDCSQFMQRLPVVPLNGEWLFSSVFEENWNATDFDDSSWENITTPMGIIPPSLTSSSTGNTLFHRRQHDIETEVSLGTPGYWRQSFGITLPTVGNWVFRLQIFVTEATEVYLNGQLMELKSQQDQSFYFRKVVEVDETALNPAGENFVAIYQSGDIYYFNSEVVWEAKCAPTWLGENCDIFDEPEVEESPKGSNYLILILGLSLGTVALGGALGGFLVWRYKIRRTPLNISPDMEDPNAGNEWEINYHELELGSKIGEGAFGVVFLAKWRNAQCVVKQMKVDVGDRVALRDFLREAKNMQNLRPHPNVCDLLGVCTKPDTPVCIVTEFLSEGSISDLIAKGKIEISVQMAVSIGKNIASGMSHLHSENILHCDLAARNLLVTLKGKDEYIVKVADFGLSHISETENYNIKAETKFPIRWSAPEVMTRHQVGKPSDVWAFGVTMWEIIEQKKPYHDILSNADVMEAVCSRGVILPPPTRLELPEEIWALIKTCFEIDPKDRPSFQELYKKFSELDERWNPRGADDHTMPLLDLHTYAFTPSQYSQTPHSVKPAEKGGWAPTLPKEYEITGDTSYAPIGTKVVSTEGNATAPSSDTAYAPIGNHVSFKEFQKDTAYSPIGHSQTSKTSEYSQTPSASKALEESSYTSVRESASAPETAYAPITRNENSQTSPSTGGWQKAKVDLSGFSEYSQTPGVHGNQNSTEMREYSQTPSKSPPPEETSYSSGSILALEKKSKKK